MKRLLLFILFFNSYLYLSAQVLHSAYDVNGDGKVDIQDLTYIVSRINGKIKDDVIHQSTIKIDTIHYQVIVKDTIYQHSTVHIVDTIRSFFKDSVYQYTQTIPQTNPQTEKTSYTINGVEYPMPEEVDLGLPSGNIWYANKQNFVRKSLLSILDNDTLKNVYVAATFQNIPYNGGVDPQSSLIYDDDNYTDGYSYLTVDYLNTLFKDWHTPDRFDFLELYYNTKATFVAGGHYTPDYVSFIGKNGVQIIFPNCPKYWIREEGYTLGIDAWNDTPIIEKNTTGTALFYPVKKK